MNFHDKRITQLEQGIDKIAETMANLVLMTEAVADWKDGMEQRVGALEIIHDPAQNYDKPTPEAAPCKHDFSVPSEVFEGAVKCRHCGMHDSSKGQPEATPKFDPYDYSDEADPQSDGGQPEAKKPNPDGLDYLRKAYKDNHPARSALER